jgi:hypothetical protein
VAVTASVLGPRVASSAFAVRAYPTEVSRQRPHGGDQRYHYTVAAGSTDESVTILKIAEAHGWVTKAESAYSVGLGDRELALKLKLMLMLSLKLMPMRMLMLS